MSGGGSRHPHARTCSRCHATRCSKLACGGIRLAACQPAFKGMVPASLQKRPSTPGSRAVSVRNTSSVSPFAGPDGGAPTRRATSCVEIDWLAGVAAVRA
jgi:hypothetical protein